MKEIRNWWIRIFMVITTDRARSLRLVPYRNIYGDEINRLNCRSEWQDNKGRLYRVHEIANLLSAKPKVGYVCSSLDNNGDLVFYRVVK